MKEQSDQQTSLEGIDFSEQANAGRGGFNTALGLRFVRCTLDEIVAEIDIVPEHHQPYGLVHGGVYCSIIETVCSVGAAANAMQRGQTAVGLENSTSFLRAAREGIIRVRATPLSRGRRSQVWEAAVRDGDDRLLAQGRVRMICLEAGAQAGGEVVKMKVGPAKDD